MHLEHRTDARQVVGVALDDRMRVPDVDGDEADAVHLLGVETRHLAEVLLDEPVLASIGPHLARADADA